MILDPLALWGKEMSHEEMMRLIEAAPDLLDALIVMRKYFYTRYTDGYRDQLHRITKADAAIFKATGAQA